MRGAYDERGEEIDFRVRGLREAAGALAMPVAVQSGLAQQRRVAGFGDAG